MSEQAKKLSQNIEGPEEKLRIIWMEDLKRAIIFEALGPLENPRPQELPLNFSQTTKIQE